MNTISKSRQFTDPNFMIIKLAKLPLTSCVKVFPLKKLLAVCKCVKKQPGCWTGEHLWSHHLAVVCQSASSVWWQHYNLHHASAERQHQQILTSLADIDHQQIVIAVAVYVLCGILCWLRGDCFFSLFWVESDPLRCCPPLHMRQEPLVGFSMWLQSGYLSILLIIMCGLQIRLSGPMSWPLIFTFSRWQNQTHCIAVLNFFQFTVLASGLEQVLWKICSVWVRWADSTMKYLNMRS